MVDTDDEGTSHNRNNKLLIEAMTTKMEQLMNDKLESFRQEIRRRKDRESSSQVHTKQTGSRNPVYKRCDYMSKSLTFSGSSKDPEVYLRWETNMKQWLRANDIPKEDELSYVVDNLVGDAYKWWLKANARTFYNYPVQDWRDLKSRMYGEFVKKHQTRSHLTTNPMYQAKTRSGLSQPALRREHSYYKPREVLTNITKQQGKAATTNGNEKVLKLETHPTFKEEMDKFKNLLNTSFSMIKHSSCPKVVETGLATEGNDNTRGKPPEIQAHVHQVIKGEKDRPAKLETCKEVIEVEPKVLKEYEESSNAHLLVPKPISKLKEQVTSSLISCAENFQTTCLMHLSTSRELEKGIGTKEELNSTKDFQNPNQTHGETTQMLNEIATKDAESVDDTIQIKEKPPDAPQPIKSRGNYLDSQKRMKANPLSLGAECTILGLRPYNWRELEAAIQTTSSPDQTNQINDGELFSHHRSQAQNHFDVYLEQIQVTHQEHIGRQSNLFEKAGEVKQYLFLEQPILLFEALTSLTNLAPVLPSEIILLLQDYEDKFPEGNPRRLPPICDDSQNHIWRPGDYLKRPKTVLREILITSLHIFFAKLKKDLSSLCSSQTYQWRPGELSLSKFILRQDELDSNNALMQEEPPDQTPLPFTRDYTYLQGKYNLSPSFNVSDLVPFVADQTDLRTNLFQVGEDDASMDTSKLVAEDAMAIPTGPMTRSKIKLLNQTIENLINQTKIQEHFHKGILMLVQAN